MRRSRVFFFLFIALICAGHISEGNGGQSSHGKFYIVGMGTAADLITIRGVEVIKSADILLVGGVEDQAQWSEYTKNKEVWFCPNSLRALYGVETTTIKRARAENNMKARQELADKIHAAVQSGKTVAFLQSGDPMIFGQTFLLEMLPNDVSTEIVPGIGSFQAASAAAIRQGCARKPHPAARSRCIMRSN